MLKRMCLAIINKRLFLIFAVFFVQPATGITPGKRACRTCRRGSSRGCRCRCRGMRTFAS